MSDTEEAADTNSETVTDTHTHQPEFTVLFIVPHTSYDSTTDTDSSWHFGTTSAQTSMAPTIPSTDVSDNHRYSRHRAKKFRRRGQGKRSKGLDGPREEQVGTIAITNQTCMSNISST